MKKTIIPLMMLLLASCSNPSSSSGISNDLSSIYVNPGIQESFSTQTYELYNQDCQQIYLLVVEGDSSYIKNKNTEEVVERFSNNDNPYLKGDYAYMIYVDDPEYSGLYKHIAVIDDKLYDLDKEEYIDVNDRAGFNINS